jgi:hypothetical protein
MYAVAEYGCSHISLIAFPNLCRSSYNIMRVKQAFDFAYQQLSAPCDSRESRLARILRWACCRAMIAVLIHADSDRCAGKTVGLRCV